MTIEAFLIPGTTQVCLANDPTGTPKCLAAGSVKIEPTLEPVFARFARPDAVALDIGAYIGDSTRMLLDLGFHTIAFEPQPDAFYCLQHNCPSAVVYNAAVGNGEPTVLGQDTIAGNLGTRQTPVDPSGNSTLRIDDLDLPKVSFVKLDIEGFEPYALRGMQNLLRRDRPVLLVEVYRTLLASQGFNVFDIVNELPGYRFEVAVGDANEDRCDILALPL